MKNRKVLKINLTWKVKKYKIKCKKKETLGHMKGEAVTSPFDNTKCPKSRQLI